MIKKLPCHVLGRSIVIQRGCRQCVEFCGVNAPPARRGEWNTEYNVCTRCGMVLMYETAEIHIDSARLPWYVADYFFEQAPARHCAMIGGARNTISWRPCSAMLMFGCTCASHELWYSFNCVLEFLCKCVLIYTRTR